MKKSSNIFNNIIKNEKEINKINLTITQDLIKLFRINII